MKVFIDECLSPQLAIRLNDKGLHDAIHPLHVGRRGEPDHRVLERCIDEDRVIVTENAGDFRKLAAAASHHPGLIILPPVDREGTWSFLQAALGYLERLGNPEEVIAGHVLEVTGSGEITLLSLPG